MYVNLYPNTIISNLCIEIFKKYVICIFVTDPADHMHAVEPGTGLESHSALVLGRALHDFVGETDNELTLQVIWWTSSFFFSPHSTPHFSYSPSSLQPSDFFSRGKSTVQSKLMMDHLDVELLSMENPFHSRSKNITFFLKSKVEAQTPCGLAIRRVLHL